jgi:chromosomal replication initiator protein
MITENKQLWDSVLSEIELTVSRANFSTWFKNTHIAKQENGIVFVGVQNEFVKEWLVSKNNKFILKLLRDRSESVRGVEYIIATKNTKEEHILSERNKKPAQTQELPLHDLYINRDDNLNPRYTFENLIIGPFNELAFAASQAVAKNPGVAYNPLFIHGNTGLGKTHITQAIGNHIKTEKPSKKVYYITSEKFAMDYVSSLQSNRVNEFKERYRKYDVFIMDDIQFMTGKDKTQEELFHLFNTLYENNKQIIFSSDKHPNYIVGLEGRLKTRFGAGMIVDITPPEYESRVAIIRHKFRISDFTMSDENISFVASSLDCSVREMEGILNSIICQSRLKNKELGLTDLKALIKNNVSPKKNVSVKDVIRTVSGFYNVEEAVLFEKTRRKEVVKPRQVAMYILREHFNFSYPTIGEKFGGRDHTTVMHSCDKVKSDIKENIVFAEEIEQIRGMLA